MYTKLIKLLTETEFGGDDQQQHADYYEPHQSQQQQQQQRNDQQQYDEYLMGIQQGEEDNDNDYSNAMEDHGRSDIEDHDEYFSRNKARSEADEA